MILSSRSLLVGLFASAGVALVVVACGSSDDSKFKDNGGTTPIFGDASFNGDAGEDPNGELYKDDPPAAYCGPNADGGTAGDPTVGGSVDCPDDKNKPGCGCLTAGQTAPCWTGLRANRNLGICHDGQTKCIAQGEQQPLWGPCEGQKLPDPGVTTGAQGCACFSVGTWKIANTAPCIRLTGTGAYYAYSTLPPNASNPGQPLFCGEPDGTTAATIAPPNTDAPGTWSTDTLTTDCAGTFDICFRVRVGDVHNPSGNDCIMGESCVHVDYLKENVEQTLPELPPWHTTDSACVQKWEKDTPDNVSPGYGEMVVKGESVRCETTQGAQGTEFVFNRVEYCAKACRDPAHANDDECKSCQLSGKGEFSASK